MVQYRVYDRYNLDYVDGGVIRDYTVDMDYISNNASTITLPDETYAKKGDVVVVMSGTEKLFMGCVTAVDNTKKTISFKHMKELFNDTVLNIFKYASILGYKFDAVEAVYEIIRLGFIDNTDTKRRLPMILEKRGTATGAVWTDESDTINVLDFIGWVFDGKNVYLDFDIDFVENKIRCVIIKNITTGFVIKDNIKLSEPAFDKNELPAQNTAIVYNADSGTIYGTYYLLADNTVTTNASHAKRLLPAQTKYVSYNPNDENTTFTPLEVATSELQGNIYNHCIQYKLAKEQNMVKATAFKYGDGVKIIYNEREYDSIFTGLKFNSTDPYYTCFFGKTRIDFTDRLKLYIDKRYRKKGG